MFGGILTGAGMAVPQFSCQLLDKFTTERMWNSNSHASHQQQWHQQTVNFANFSHDFCSYCNIPISISEPEQWNHLMLCHQDLIVGGLWCSRCKMQFPNRGELLKHLMFTWNKEAVTWVSLSKAGVQYYQNLIFACVPESLKMSNVFNSLCITTRVDATYSPNAFRIFQKAYSVFD